MGIVSVILWSIVSFKYAILIMRADNRGEGGISRCLALLDVRHAPARSWRGSLLIVGLIGAALLYGDGVITPAISVLSAVEGLKLDAPQLAPAVVPISIAILIGLFLVQRKGTAFIGNIFGPVMLMWFIAIGLLGLGGIIGAPGILSALSPHHRAVPAEHRLPGIRHWPRQRGVSDDTIVEESAEKPMEAASIIGWIQDSCRSNDVRYSNRPRLVCCRFARVALIIASEVHGVTAAVFSAVTWGREPGEVTGGRGIYRDGSAVTASVRGRGGAPPNQSQSTTIVAVSVWVSPLSAVQLKAITPLSAASVKKEMNGFAEIAGNRSARNTSTSLYVQVNRRMISRGIALPTLSRR